MLFVKLCKLRQTPARAGTSPPSPEFQEHPLSLEAGEGQVTGRPTNIGDFQFQCAGVHAEHIIPETHFGAGKGGQIQAGTLDNRPPVRAVAGRFGINIIKGG